MDISSDAGPGVRIEVDPDSSGAAPSRYDVKAEVINESVAMQQVINIHPQGGSAGPRLEDLPEDMPTLLPPNLHPYQDPRHDHLRGELEARRVLLLTSYEERAAYSAAYSLAQDDHFHDQVKRVLFPARNRDKERLELDLAALARQEFLGEAPQFLLIEIQRGCTFLDSALSLTHGDSAKICSSLRHHDSYLVLVVNEELLRDPAASAEARKSLPCYTVSHLRYLLTGHAVARARADELESRFLAGLAKSGGSMELRELYQRVEEQIKIGFEALEKLLADLESAGSLPLAQRIERLQPVRPQDVLRDDSELHRAAVFAATYIPDLSQGDFDRIVLTLLGDKAAKEQRTRHIVGKDGEVVSVSEEVSERWSDRWRRDADRVFQDSHVRMVDSGEGAWVVDFTQPYLRRELKGHLERYSPWYVREQCRLLQSSGALFSFDLSLGAVEGLVRFFVARALVDPSGFGSRWLLDLVRSLRLQLPEPPPEEDPEKVLEWLLTKVATEAQLRNHFYSRLALLIREMLDREALRSKVSDFFEYLISAGRHDALLSVVLDLARRLRFAPHFDPLTWMRRLLDQGSGPVRRKAVKRLLGLARISGPRIYKFLDAVRMWLPEDGRAAERYSNSNVFALELPFAYCLAVFMSLPPEHLGAWPSRHPLFYALPEDPVEARQKIAELVEWILDPRGVQLEKSDERDPMRTAKFIRLEHVAGLVEQWAWVLEGAADSGPEAGRQFFRVILEEVSLRLGETERLWFQRIWQRRQDEYLQQAARCNEADYKGRRQLVARRDKLNQLRMRLADLGGQSGSNQTNL